MAEAVKLEEAEDYVVKSYLQFVEGCKFFQTSEDTPFVAALKAYLETGKISEPLECCKPSKENAEEKSTRRRGRRQDNTTALKEISENDMQIKSEKISEVYSESSTASSTASETVTVKSEKEEMPAPAKLPPWKKKIKTEAEEPKRSTRTRGRKNKEETAKKESNVRDSDVQIQNSTVTTIEISDESDADKKSDVVSDTDSERSTRSTRTKTRKNKEAEKVENDTEELPKRVTRTKARKKNADEEEESKKADELPKRSTRTKTKAKQTMKLDENIEDGTEEEVETRSTRTKTRAKNAKRIRSESTDIESTKQTENKRSRSDSGSEQQIEENTTAKTVFEDAQTSVDELPQPTPADATFVKTPEHQPPPISDATVVVDKPKVLNVANGRPETTKTTVKDDDLFTDDESEEEEAQKKGKGKIIQVFSPYDKTPVKNKVKAFEKLAQTSSSSSSNIPRCVPRQKPSPDATRPPKSATPLQSAFLPKVCSTSKIQKTLPKTDASFTQQQRSHSALKVSSAEYRERERQRAEKEREAQRKKDAMLAAIVEEKRRRREEKVARAQQQREAREAEKRRLVEAQQAREEKHRRAMQEREERAARQREEQERRRAVAKAKAAEAQREKEMMEKLEADRERLQELEARKLEKLKALQQQRLLQQQQLPVYMTTRPPPLPTFDCYDSDDPEYDNAQRRRGDTWDNDKHMKMVQCTMMSAGDKIKNTLFCVQAQSVNLTEIFENIDPRKLKRTSSAIWRRPPRFTMIPNLEETRFSEDEEEYEDATQ